MPNHIKNQIRLEGDEQQIKTFCDTFTTNHPPRLSRTYDGKDVICYPINDEEDIQQIGYFNLNTGKFKRRNSNEEELGLPEGWEMKIEAGWNRFPDFNKIIPMPKEVEESMGKPIGKGGIFPDWYSWCVDNWGTKWNSYTCEKINDKTYQFDTAWCGVPDLVLKMSGQFPELTFHYKFSDEDTGYNQGDFIIKNGEIIEDNSPEDGSKEAYDLAFELRPHYKEYYQLIDGKWVYNEDE